jgi:hypothetical protein
MIAISLDHIYHPVSQMNIPEVRVKLGRWVLRQKPRRTSFILSATILKEGPGNTQNALELNSSLCTGIGQLSERFPLPSSTRHLAKAKQYSPQKRGTFCVPSL